MVQERSRDLVATRKGGSTLPGAIWQMMRFWGQRSDAMHYSVFVPLPPPHHLSTSSEGDSRNNGSGKKDKREKKDAIRCRRTNLYFLPSTHTFPPLPILRSFDTEPESGPDCPMDLKCPHIVQSRSLLSSQTVVHFHELRERFVIPFNS